MILCYILLLHLETFFFVSKIQPAEKSSHGTLPVDGLAGALARALAERSKAIHSDSSDTSDTAESDSDEWG